MEVGYRVDILVENKVTIEVKPVKKLDKIYMAQILSYLKLSDMKLGLPINFNETFLKKGFKRVVNKL